MPHNDGKTPEEIAARIADIAAQSRNIKKPSLTPDEIEAVKHQVLDAVSKSLDVALARLRD